MTEATLKATLVRRLRERMPTAVVYRHEDKFLAGIPDISVSRAGRTVWVEVKFDRDGRRARVTNAQKVALARLRGLLVTYVRPRDARVYVEVKYPDGRTSCRFGRGAIFPHDEVASLIEQYLTEGDEETDFEKVAAFSRKFRLAPGEFRTVAEARLAHLYEEYRELSAAYDANDLVAFADGLADLVYVALGAAYELDLPWPALFDEVHRANMRKVLDRETIDGYKRGVVKPAGWLPPDVEGVLERSKRDAR